MPQPNDGLSNGFRLGELNVRPRDGSICRPDGLVHVEPKTMDVLVALAEHAGEVVTRDELIQKAWKGSPVADEPLTRCISTLRQYLEDNARQPRFLQTVPKRGYRLIAPVQRASEPTSTAHVFSAGATPKPPGGAHKIAFSPRTVAVLVALLTALGGLFLLSAIRTNAPVNSIAVLGIVNLSGDPAFDLVAEALAAGITNSLSRVGRLSVVSRTSVLSIKRHSDVREIGQRLAVRYVLEGTLRRSGDRLEMSLDLVDAVNGYQRWAGRYQGHAGKIGEIEQRAIEDLLDQFRGASARTHIAGASRK